MYNTFVLDPEAGNLSTPVFYDDGIRVSWSGATCLSSLRLSAHLSSVYEVDVKNVTGTTHYDFIPVTSGDYRFQLTSVNYPGNDIGSMNSTSIPWKEPKVSIDTNVNNNIANFTIKNNDDGRPPVTNCSIAFDDVLKSCVMNNIIIFSITSGAKHSYNITVTNAAGTVNMNGLSNQVKNTTTQVNTTMELSASIDPLAIAASPTVLGVLIILSVCWILLRICWKRQWCCPRIWRSSFWLLFFCYDCCTYDAGVKGKATAINAGLNNPTVGGEKGPDTTL
uniref:Fibronectin type-III domain-containing protein n=1 Tax=Amphimedon queenslandica TaxID=400682 RepID=A0A1X7T6D2_AMPQE